MNKNAKEEKLKTMKNLAKRIAEYRFLKGYVTVKVINPFTGVTLETLEFKV